MKKLYFLVSLSLIAITSFSQKLPDVQVVGMLPPTGIKIDGKALEWNNQYAAENKRTELYYSLANDDKNLYLIVKSANTINTNKIMLGGVTFTVNPQGKKRDQAGLSVTYPLINRGNRSQGGRNQGQNRQGGSQGRGQNRVQQSQEQRDSIVLITRKTQLTTAKEIRVGGFKNITDSLISIYNEYGIKAVGNFDQKGNYVYELAIPLTLLEIADKKDFAYQLKLNGLNNVSFGDGGKNAGRNGLGGNGGGRAGSSFGGGGNGGGNNVQDLMSPTDFWGKYTLIKK